MQQTTVIRSNTISQWSNNDFLFHTEASTSLGNDVVVIVVCRQTTFLYNNEQKTHTMRDTVSKVEWKAKMLSKVSSLFF